MEAPTQPANVGGFSTRRATGLVRELGISSNVVLNLSLISLPLAALVATEVPFAFPGANLPLVIAITAALCVLPTGLYGWLATAMPRSGGDFVFVSRILHPVIGFAASFNVTMWFLLVIAQFGSLLAPFGLSAALATIGSATGEKGLVDASATVAGQGWQFGVGAVALVLTAVLVSFRLRSWTRVLMALCILSLAGVAIAAVLLLLHGRADFQQSLLRFGGSYDGIIKSASHAGYTGGGSFSLENTLAATPLAFASFGYAIATTYVGGEVRSPQRILLKALLGALAISAVVVLVLMLLAVRTFGQNFLGAVTYLSNVDPRHYPLAAPPFLFLFTAMLTRSSLLIAVMAISFALAFFVALPPAFLVATRNLFAWSLDRILPDKVSEVSGRTHAPVVANLIVLAITLGYLALIVFGPSQFLTLLFTAGAAQLLTFIVVALAGTVFPWRGRRLFEESALTPSRGGLPAISVAGFLSVGVYLLFLVPLLANDTLGANAAPGIVAMVVTALVPLLIVAASYLVNRRRGVDLKVTFRELPPE